MNYVILPQKNDTMFYMDKEIVVLKVYSSFRMARIQFVQTKLQAVIDINALTSTPELGNSISIRILGGV